MFLRSLTGWKAVAVSSMLLGMLAACGPGDVGEDAEEGSISSELNSSMYTKARAFAAAHPRRANGASWDQWCGALMVEFGPLPASAVRPTATAAYHASKIVSTDASKAYVGALHWWSIGSAGHVGVDLNGGGSTVFMATSHLSAAWGTAIGINSVGHYSAQTGAHYLGWSMDYAGARMPGGGAAPVTGGIPRTTTEQNGIPGPIFYTRVQTVGRRDFGYDGPINGITGPNTEKARVRLTARELNGRGGPRTAAQEDGIPGKIYWTRVQTVGRASFGYDGPINGIPGPNTYKAEFKIGAYAVNRAF